MVAPANGPARVGAPNGQSPGHGPDLALVPIGDTRARGVGREAASDMKPPPVRPAAVP